MVLCFLIGNILLIAVAASFPMYRTASFQRMLTDEFRAYYVDYGEWPAIFTVSHTKSIGKNGVSYEQLRGYVDECNEKLAVTIKQEIQYLSTSAQEVSPVIERDERISRKFRVSYMTDLEENITFVAGRMAQEGRIQNEYLEVIVTESCASTMNILLDEVYEYEKFTFLDGTPLRIKIVGFFQATNEGDCYWVENPSQLHRDLFVPTNTFFDFFIGNDAEKAYGLKKVIYELWDYTQIRPADVKDILLRTSELVAADTNGSLIKDNVYEGIIQSYSAKAKKVEASLIILQIPVLALLLAFIYMISSQMMNMAQNEISVMKSRGAKGKQILLLYFWQNVILNSVALVIGIPIGRGFCALLGTTTDFMEFSGQKVLEVTYTRDVFLYAMFAVILSMFITIIPAFQHSKTTIVAMKQGEYKKKKSLWKRLYLDLICIGIAIYGYQLFARNQSSMVEQILTGKSLDPLLYLSSSLFLFGFGLLAVRIQPIFLKLLFLCRKHKGKPASYVSFLYAIRSGKKQEFHMLFMILTLSI